MTVVLRLVQMQLQLQLNLFADSNPYQPRLSNMAARDERTGSTPNRYPSDDADLDEGHEAALRIQRLWRDSFLHHRYRVMRIVDGAQMQALLTACQGRPWGFYNIFWDEGVRLVYGLYNTIQLRPRHPYSLMTMEKLCLCYGTSIGKNFAVERTCDGILNNPFLDCCWFDDDKRHFL